MGWGEEAWQQVSECDNLWLGLTIQAAHKAKALAFNGARSCAVALPQARCHFQKGNGEKEGSASSS